MREAQRFERRVGQLSACHRIALAFLEKNPMKSDDVKAAFQAGNGKTLGALLQRYRTELSKLGVCLPSEPLTSELDDVLAVRNFLAHHFFERQFGDEFTAIPTCFEGLPGNHRFTEEYLDNIHEPHPIALRELGYAHELFARNVHILDRWLAAVLDTLGIRP